MARFANRFGGQPILISGAGRGLGVERWPGRFAARVAFHRSCHSRGTRYGESALALLRSTIAWWPSIVIALVTIGKPSRLSRTG